MPKQQKPLTEEDIDGPNPVTKAFKKHNITVDYLARKLKEELESHETKFFAHQGEVIQQEDVINWGTRQKARQDAHKLRGDYPAEKVDLDGDIIVNIQATPLEQKREE